MREEARCRLCGEVKTCCLFSSEALQGLELSGSESRLYYEDNVFICDDCEKEYRKECDSE